MQDVIASFGSPCLELWWSIKLLSNVNKLLKWKIYSIKKQLAKTKLIKDYVSVLANSAMHSHVLCGTEPDMATDKVQSST